MGSNIEKIYRRATDFAEIAREQENLKQLILEGPKNEEQSKQLKIDFLDTAKKAVEETDPSQQSLYLSVLLDLFGPLRGTLDVK